MLCCCSLLTRASAGIGQKIVGTPRNSIPLVPTKKKHSHTWVGTENGRSRRPEIFGQIWDVVISWPQGRRWGLVRRAVRFRIGSRLKPRRSDRCPTRPPLHSPPRPGGAAGAAGAGILVARGSRQACFSSFKFISHEIGATALGGRPRYSVGAT